MKISEKSDIQILKLKYGIKYPHENEIQQIIVNYNLSIGIKMGFENDKKEKLTWEERKKRFNGLYKNFV